jgi:hypothetical protein
MAGGDTKAGRVLLIRAWLDLNTSFPRYRYYPEWLSYKAPKQRPIQTERGTGSG